jgi:hypothetical protein
VQRYDLFLNLQAFWTLFFIKKRIFIFTFPESFGYEWFNLIVVYDTSSVIILSIPARQLVGKTRWVFRQPHGLSVAWFLALRLIQLDDSLDWTHPADGRPSGSSLQAVEQADLDKSIT